MNSQLMRDVRDRCTEAQISGITDFKNPEKIVRIFTGHRNPENQNKSVDTWYIKSVF